MGKVYLTLDKLLASRNMSRYELAKRTGSATRETIYKSV